MSLFVTRLDAHHERDWFDSGRPELDERDLGAGEWATAPAEQAEVVHVIEEQRMPDAFAFDADGGRVWSPTARDKRQCGTPHRGRG